jgi:CelD/BcsL family acetyltransferase involved in cellulose biosynthesis
VTTEHLQVARITSIYELDSHKDAWRGLAAGMPMHLPEWFLTWWEFYAAPEDVLWILLLHAPEGPLVGLAPLYLQDAGNRKILRILGSADACTHHINWLTSAGWEKQVGIEVARFLIQCKSGWKKILFEAVDGDAAAIHTTMEHLAENGFLCHRRRINNVWKINLPKTWEDYLMMLSRSHRKRCRKLQRMFLDSGMIQLRQVENEADLKKGLEVLFRLHGTRWGSTRKPLGVFGDQRFRKFHATVSQKLLDCNQLRLAWLEYDGTPLAIEYQFFDTRSVYAYQAGVDLSKNEFSPGRLSMMAAIQFAISKGCEFFDLLRGDEPYKANWRAAPMACYDLRVWQDRITGRLAWMVWNSYTHAAGKLKSIIPNDIINWGLRTFQALFRRSSK